MSDSRSEEIIVLTAELISAYVSNNPVPVGELPSVIAQVHQALARLGDNESVQVEEPPKPAVNPKKSVYDDHIVCLEDGKKFKSLKRHLMSRYSMTPEDYRTKWSLAADYPMVAPNYAAARSALAKQMGLGRRAAPAAVTKVAKPGTPKSYAEK